MSMCIDRVGLINQDVFEKLTGIFDDEVPIFENIMEYGCAFKGLPGGIVDVLAKY